MPPKTTKGKIAEKQVEQSIQAYNDLQKALKGVGNEQERLAQAQEAYADKQRLINDLTANHKALNAEQTQLLLELVSSQAKDLKLIREKVTAAKQETAQLKEQKKLLDEQIKKRQQLLAFGKAVVDQFKIGWKYLQDSDKIIKQTILSLGMSGTKANEMRLSFEQTIGLAGVLGAAMEDLAKIQMGFADETGRARTLSKETLLDIVAIGKGTGLGIENATKLAAQFEFMGVDAKNTVKFVQGVVDTSERMGVNTTKVLKNVTDNFKKLGTFSFKNGTKAFGEMAMMAEKTRVSMKTALDVAEAKRSLEDVIELGANLQVMGGNFAKMDPFQWLYTVRNEPEKLNEEISKMTTGMYTLKKNSEGVFERFISPADVDRLTNVAKSLGISKEEMFEIAQKRLDLQNMDKALAGTGLTKKEKELVEGAAKLNQETGRYEVSLAGRMTDVRDLTKEQAESFVKEQKTLEERAKEAQTFNEVMVNTVNELKGALLPILRVINTVLGAIRPYFDMMGKLAGSGPGSIIAAGTILMGAALAWKGIVWGLGNVMKNWAAKKGAAAALEAGGSNLGGNAGPPVRDAKGRFAKAQPFKTGARSFGQSAGIGAAVGLAAVGVGAGIGLAAVGISKLADSMSKLTDKQAETLKSIVTTISVMVGIGALAAAVLIGLGAAAGTAAAPLGLFGGALSIVGLAVLEIGAGIGLATAGISLLVNAISNATSKAADTASLVSAFSSMTIDSDTISSMESIASNSGKFAIIGTSFSKIGAAMSGHAADFIAVKDAIEGISNANLTSGGMLTELANLLKSPLKVEFADKTVRMTNDITLLIDGQKLMHNTYDVNVAIQKHVAAVNGTGGHKK